MSGLHRRRSLHGPPLSRDKPCGRGGVDSQSEHRGAGLHGNQGSFGEEQLNRKTFVSEDRR